MLKNPELRKRLEPSFDKGPETRIHDGDFKRSTLVKKEDSSDSSGSSDLDAEEEKIHKELEKLIKESKRLTEGKELSSSSRSQSSSSSSS